MSDLRLVLAFVGTAAAMLNSVPLGAQASSATIDSLLRRVHALDSSLILRSRAVDSIRQSLVRSVPPVHVRHGPLEVRTIGELESRVRPAVDSVAALIERRGGPSLASRVAVHVPTVVRDSTRTFFGPLPVIEFASDTLRRWSSVRQRSIPARASSAEIADALAGMVEQFAIQAIDSALTAWIMVGRVPLRPASSTEAADAYIEMMTTESSALRRCQSGDTDSCLDVLGVDSLPGTRLQRWYAPRDYRALLRIVAPPRDDSIAVAAWLRCRQDRDEASCTVAASALPNDRVPPPLSAPVRLMFLRTVLEAGGAQAYERLASGTGPVRARLASAAGEPLETTVRRWRARVVESRPERMHVPASLVLASLGWTSAVLGLTLIRRGPWV